MKLDGRPIKQRKLQFQPGRMSAASRKAIVDHYLDGLDQRQKVREAMRQQKRDRRKQPRQDPAVQAEFYPECQHCGGTREVAESSTRYMACPACCGQKESHADTP